MSSFTAPIESLGSVQEVDEIKKSNKSTVLFFWAEWHEPSNIGGQMYDVISTLASKYPTISFKRIDAEDAEMLSIVDLYKVEMVPTCICIKGDNIFGKIEGVNPPGLSKLIKKFSVEASIVKDPQEILNTRLKHIIETAPVMLFMKGTPNAPRCGFSRKMIALLQDNDIEFATFDILEDEEVRQGLKVYSEWPTYPQLYVKGELQGGLDIAQELAASGNMKEAMGLDDTLSDLNQGETLDMRIKRLINTAEIMLFMKGNPEGPRCGFSRTIVSLLQDNNIEFSTFDILEDEEVRQRLKTYSDWPTYPQVYVKGELVGGLDIIKELAASGDGDLKTQLMEAV